MLNISVLVSGGGTNLQALINAQKRGEIPNGRISLVVASRPDAYALKRAEKAGISSIVLRRKEFVNQDTYDDALLGALADHQTGLVILAGFLTIIK